MSSIRAVAFDLYGTLVQIGRPVFRRQFAKQLGVAPRAWVDFVRQVLFVTAFPSREAFVERALQEFSRPKQRSDELRRTTLALLEEEIASVRLLPGVLSLLRFLRRRGLGLGLISNLASPYREPFRDLGLEGCFDAVAFSCEREIAKPEPELYLGLCRDLGVLPEETLVVGDSLQNDVATPRRLGLHAVRVAGPGADDALPGAAALGWHQLTPHLRPLLEVAAPLLLGTETVRLESLEPLHDEQQGRYNLVLAARVIRPRGLEQRVYFKRYLLPESAQVEAFLHQLLALVEIETVPAGILSGPEPLFWSFEALGERVEEVELTPVLAFDIGRHGASAFLFSNADFRPRNAILPREGKERSGRRLVMLDHEHWLFDLALDVEGISDPFDPHALDALGTAELERRVRRRVLSPPAIRRAYREFFGARGQEPELRAAFRAGWTELHRLAQSRRECLRELLLGRVYSPPYLIIGTKGYRRALAGLDIRDVLERLAMEPEQALDSWMLEPPMGRGLHPLEP